MDQGRPSYAVSSTFKESRHERKEAMKQSKSKKINSMLQHELYDFLQEDENTELSRKNQLQYYNNIYSDIDEKELYKLYKLSLDDSHID